MCTVDLIFYNCTLKIPLLNLAKFMNMSDDIKNLTSVIMGQKIYTAKIECSFEMGK